MNFNLKDVSIETKRGRGKGGQRRNKVETCVRATHLPTGITVEIDNDRTQIKNKREALQILEQRVRQLELDEQAARKKEKRDYAIHNTETIRTYDFRSGLVRDHRSGKVASLKDVLRKGKIELLHPEAGDR